MKIRKAKKTEHKEVAKLMKTEFNKPPFKDKWTTKTAIIAIKHKSKTHTILIAEENKIITGFITFRIEYRDKGKSATIEDLVVSSKFQRKGIGTQLVKKTEEILKKQGVNLIVVSTHKKAPAFKFYRKQGYGASRNTVFLGKGLK